MPMFSRRTRAAPMTTTTTRPRGGLFSSRRRAAPVATTRAPRTTRHTRRTKHTTAVAHRPTIGDRIHGIAKRITGTLTFNRRKKRQGEAMQHGSRTVAATSRRRRRW